MFTYLIYLDFLQEPDGFWAPHHIATLWGLGVYFDFLLLLIFYVGFNSVSAGGTDSGAERARARLSALSAALRRIDRGVMILGGVVLSILVLVTFVSVTGRTFYKPVPDDITIAEWALVGVVALMLGTLQGREDHIEITALSDILSYRTNLWLRLLGAVTGLVAVGRLGLISLQEVPDSFLEITYGSIYELPGWPPRVIFMVGLGWWITRMVFQFLLLPTALRCERREDTGWLDMWPLISRTGSGDLDSVENPFFEEDETSTIGGPRGS